MTRISIVGAGGRMGGALIDCLPDNMTLVELVEAPDSPLVDQPVSERHAFYSGPLTFSKALTQDADVVIDFAVGEGLGSLAKACAQKNMALVSGRTGVSEAEEAEVSAVTDSIAVVRAGNMALGPNLLVELARVAATALPQADVEIFEVHHNQKVDAPSGTALMVADGAAGALGRDRSQYVYGREGQTGKRSENEIAIHSIRSGSTVGEHTITFGLQDERIEITHRAYDRKIFARGALQAAAWIAQQKPGLYSMKDVLGF